MRWVAGERGPNTQGGMVLVIVLWIVTLLAVMASGFAYSMRVETRLATSTVERAKARALAEAGVAYAVARQLDQENSRKDWPPNGDPHDWTFGGGRLRIQVTDAGGLVSLNGADAELLRTLFAGGGVDSQERERVVEAILDWREPDRQRMRHGAPGAGYRPGRPDLEQSRFESIEELRQASGISLDVYERIAGMVTVFADHNGVNPELAPAGLLEALGLDQRTVADYVTARARAAADGSSPPSLSRGGSQSIFSGGGQTGVYHISVIAALEAGTAAGVEAVVDTQGTIGFVLSRKPRLLAWRDGP